MGYFSRTIRDCFICCFLEAFVGGQSCDGGAQSHYPVPSSTKENLAQHFATNKSAIHPSGVGNPGPA